MSGIRQQIADPQDITVTRRQLLGTPAEQQAASGGKTRHERPAGSDDLFCFHVRSLGSLLAFGGGIRTARPSARGQGETKSMPRTRRNESSAQTESPRTCWTERDKRP